MRRFKKIVFFLFIKACYGTFVLNKNRENYYFCPTEPLLNNSKKIRIMLQEKIKEGIIKVEKAHLLRCKNV